MAHVHKDLNRQKNIALVFFINIAFTIIEIVGGIMTNSVAVLSDAVHDFGDGMALGLSWFMERIANRKKDRVFSFGYKRFSLLSAVINGIVLLLGSVVILYEAIPRLLHPQPVHASGMMALAVLGILVNGYAALRLHKGKSMNEHVLTLHLLEDVLGWVAVLVVGVAMKLGDFPFLDPLLSILITAIIVYNALKRLKRAIKIFLQSIPDDVDLAAIEKVLLNQANVCAVHDTHIWSLDGAHHVLSSHLVVGAPTSLEETSLLKRNIRQALHELDIHHITLEIEPSEDACPIDDDSEPLS